MEQTNAIIIEDRRLFIKIRNEQKLLDWVGNHLPDSPERRAIRATLNFYEFVAIGIREHTWTRHYIGVPIGPPSSLIGYP